MSERQAALLAVIESFEGLWDALDVRRQRARRDRFAAAALQGLPPGWSHEEAADHAKRRADALIEDLER